MVQCEECNMWRLVFSKCKLFVVQHHQLQRLLDDYSYSCEAKPEELDLGEQIKNVKIRYHVCGDSIENYTIQPVLNPYVVLTIHLNNTLSMRPAVIFHL